MTTILVVDDNVEIAELFRICLSLSGYQVVVAHSLKQATATGCTGVARFTCHEWDEKDGSRIVAHHSVEIQVKFDPATKKWELVDMRQWEGKF